MQYKKLRPHEIDITNIDHCKVIITDIQSQENKERKENAWKAWQVCQGNTKHFVQEELKRIYPDTWKKFRPGDISLAKNINNKKAKAYKIPPQRILTGAMNDTTQDRENELLNNIYKTGEFNRVFNEFDAIFNYYRYSCVWISYIQDYVVEPYYWARALKPYEYDLVRDEYTGVPIIFILTYDGEITEKDVYNDKTNQTITESQSDEWAEVKYYAMWTKSNHVLVKETRYYVTENNQKNLEVNFEFETIVGNENNTNPFGTLPISFLSADLNPDYPIENNLYKQSIDWNINYSDYLTAVVSQGHGQLILKHPRSQQVGKDIYVGQHTAICLPQEDNENPTDAAYINANPDLPGQLESLKFGAIRIMEEHGIKSGSSAGTDSESFTSGLDRLIAGADVQDIIESNQNLYSIVENEVYDIIKSAEKNGLGRNTFTSDSLIVHYEKPKVHITDREKLDNLEKMINLGLLEDWEKFQIVNPNMSEEEAIEKAAKVKEQTKTVINIPEGTNELSQNPEETEAEPG